jgi:hypothetical protein
MNMDFRELEDILLMVRFVRGLLASHRKRCDRHGKEQQKAKTCPPS